MVLPVIPRTIYVNWKYDNNSTETVDEFPYNNLADMKYAREMLNEYRMMPDGFYYLSQRSTNDWRES